MLMAAKRHHYVPRFLIARFADPPRGGQIVQLDKSTGRCVPTTPRNSAVIGRYYDFTTGGDEIPVEMPEDTLSLVENETAPLVEALATPGTLLTDSERLTVALFAALLSLRTPHGRDWLKLIEERSARKFLVDVSEQPEVFERIFAEIGEAGDPEVSRRNLARSLSREGVQIQAPPERQIAMMFALALDLAPVMTEMAWTILRAPESERLILGDSPLTMYDPEVEGRRRGHGLYSSPLAETVLPLDPAFALRLSPAGDDLPDVKVDVPTIRDLNLRTYAWAQRFVFGQSQAHVTGARAYARRHKAEAAVRAPRRPRLVLDSTLIDGRRSVEVIEG